MVNTIKGLFLTSSYKTNIYFYVKFVFNYGFFSLKDRYLGLHFQKKILFWEWNIFLFVCNYVTQETIKKSIWKLININFMRFSTSSNILTFDLRGFLVPKKGFGKIRHLFKFFLEKYWFNIIILFKTQKQVKLESFVFVDNYCPCHPEHYSYMTEI